MFTADEGDHFAGANVGRAVTPTCTGTPGVAIDTASAGQTPYLCSYPNGQLGEVATSVHGLLGLQKGNTAAFYSQPQGEAVYATGSSNTPSTVRQLERDFGSLTMVDPYDGATAEPVSKWMVDPTAEQLLHFVNADPNRTPSFTVFPNSDVFFAQGNSDSCPAGTTAATAPTACNPLNSSFSWNHGYYAPEIDTTWLGLAGPGVKKVGLDGPAPSAGPNSSGSAANGHTTVPQVSQHGTWVDHTDVRPTLLALAGLKDDYVTDGRVHDRGAEPSAPKATSNPGFVAAGPVLQAAELQRGPLRHRRHQGGHRRHRHRIGRRGPAVPEVQVRAAASSGRSGTRSPAPSRPTLPGRVRQPAAPRRRVPALLGCGLVLWAAGHLAA